MKFLLSRNCFKPNQCRASSKVDLSHSHNPMAIKTITVVIILILTLFLIRFFIRVIQISSLFSFTTSETSNSPRTPRRRHHNTGLQEEHPCLTTPRTEISSRNTGFPLAREITLEQRYNANFKNTGENHIQSYIPEKINKTARPYAFVRPFWSLPQQYVEDFRTYGGNVFFFDRYNPSEINKEK